MSDPRLLALSERLNKYVGLIRAQNPNMKEKEILDQASTLALTELVLADKAKFTAAICVGIGPAVEVFAASLSAEIAPVAIMAPVIAALPILSVVIALSSITVPVIRVNAIFYSF